MATKAKQKRNAKQNAEHQRAFKTRRKQQEEDRARLMAMFSAAAPDGIGKHINIRLEVEDGEDRLVWKLDDEGAAFINEFAANIDGLSVDPKAVMRELSLHIGKKLSRQEYPWQKGE